MKFIFVFMTLAAVGSGFWLSQKAFSDHTIKTVDSSSVLNERQPVLVELFTSEGCSSCPPADRVLNVLENDQLIPEAEVIALAFHVDYWNYLGWNDRFSSSEYSRRQAGYAKHFKMRSSYTPQMIVDGTFEFVGSNRAKANEIIAASAKHEKAQIELSFTDDQLSVAISDLPELSASTVFMAVAESKLTTKVGGGENSGSLLEHSSVVRELKTLGLIKPGAKSFRIESRLPKNADWKKENLEYVVFVQENSTRRVLAVMQITSNATIESRND